MKAPLRWMIPVAAIVVAGVAAMTLLAFRPRQQPGATVAGKIVHPGITEASGIVASRRFPGVYWTHNDRGNATVLYAITGDGRSIAEFRIAARSQDWEDIAVDDQGHLYIGQIGNNQADRQSVKVLCIEEPDPASGGTGKPGKNKLTVLRTIELTYPDKPFDSESLFIHQGYGYMISKVGPKKITSLYRFPLDGQADATVVLEKVADLPTRSPVTGADLSADGRHLAMVSEAGLDIFAVNNNLPGIASARRQHYPLRAPHDFEGCCFTPKGILLVSETREMLLFPDISE